MLQAHHLKNKHKIDINNDEDNNPEQTKLNKESFTEKLHNLIFQFAVQDNMPARLL